MKFWEWIKAHKTALSGYLTAAVAMIELSPAKNMIFRTDDAFALFVLIIGLVVLAIGTFNQQAATEKAVAKVAEKIVATREGGFARQSLLASLAIALMLAFAVAGPTMLTGCAAFNLQTPSNFDERVVAGYKLVETAADLVSKAHSAGKISQAQANATLDKVQELSDGIGVAADLKNAGDFSNAETRLTATISALELVLAQLRAK